jgi:beta-lysine 5,6-aminomutase beta subunit
VGIDPDKVKVPEDAALDVMGFNEVNEFIKKKVRRKIVIVGACTGSDAHTVGIDAIMNMKGYNHHFGLERYPMVDAYNLGAQVANEDLIRRCVEVKADAVLVSQVVTQKDVHLENLTELVQLLEAKKLRDRFILIVGGPQITHALARKLGFDAGFGRGTYAEHVAGFVARRLAAS